MAMTERGDAATTALTPPGVDNRQPPGSPVQRQALLLALGARVRGRREALGLTRKALAAATGLSERFIAQLETGKGNISVANLNGVARALALPLASLLGPAPAETDGAGEALRREVARLLEQADVDQLRRAAQVLGQVPGARPPSEARPLIALIGLRGAGKSTIGPLLAQRLRLPYVELDDVIQEATGLAVPEIFELHGEHYYRQAERQALARLVAADRPQLVSVSGGIVADAESFALLKRAALLVWLKATPEQHMQRVRSQGDSRPMQDRPNAMAELRQLLAGRTALYAQADIALDTGAGDETECAESLAAELTRRLRLA
ncbi:MAG: helix-turn-helix domain-containing protein [Candidatus Lambdaproteobacteria bacterium]|nr:helix-turn-helix domain-containing protein [Candidatus Lambdaproteobacteria bacterium]